MIPRQSGRQTGTTRKQYANREEPVCDAEKFHDSLSDAQRTKLTGATKDGGEARRRGASALNALLGRTVARMIAKGGRMHTTDAGHCGRPMSYPDFVAVSHDAP